jgi:hypothetical protein
MSGSPFDAMAASDWNQSPLCLVLIIASRGTCRGAGVLAALNVGFSCRFSHESKKIPAFPELVFVAKLKPETPTYLEIKKTGFQLTGSLQPNPFIRINPN